MTRRRMIAISAAAAGMALLPPHGKAAQGAVTWQGEAMGAQASLVIHHPDRAMAQRLTNDVVAEVRRLERIFSLYRDDSDLTHLNRQRFLIAPPRELVDILQQCRDVRMLTGGAFDPTVQPLWDAYRRHFSTPGASEAGPSAQVVRECLRRVGLDWVASSPDRIELSVPGAALTLNGIAQGYVTDRVVDLLKAGGIESSLVDMGESHAIGSAPGDRPWRVGVSDPLDSTRILKVLEVEDRAVATSSPFGFRFDEAGIFSHIIDPRSGATPQRHASVTVVAGQAALADALSTAFNLMDADAITAAVHGNADVEVHILSHEGGWTRIGA
ncbi:FAD:protein FMN transferase [Mesorhizobium qingshengii]|uniref:FAD:protein FMN transferase n=1 Tax=Mesorhizobium qingshengii TaxID=1165689 RepID=A0ABT4R2G6_9HYPH|nr:FAD:protein FMN transferase [Mesorhizobium qingshengii]MCZ8548028.1 FAD:protein FMN transferase [Mesorhizobium qingshengii]